MSKEVTKEDLREAVDELVHGIRITRAIINEQHPGVGDLMVEAVIGELQKLVPEKTQPEEEACEAASCDELPCGPGPAMNAANMTFGDALAALKAGKCVARKGWNGKHQYVELATCISYKAGAGEIVNVQHNNIGNKALAFVGTSGVQMGWLASQADMLAEDWYIVD